VAALVGNTYGAAKDIGVYITAEAIRGLADLEAKERERCANFATKAIAAGLAGRTVRVAERQGQLMVEMVHAALREVDLSPEQASAFKAALARQARSRGILEEGAGKWRAVFWGIDSRGRIKIESKDDMRKRGLPSPDRADAMAIAFAGRANAAPMNVESHAGESITRDLMTKAW
jgi:hypothetical protein